MAKSKKTTVTPSSYPQANAPLILRCARLIDAFAKSDEERDFHLDRAEGALILVDLDRDEEELAPLVVEIRDHAQRYNLLPKITFYEAKKLMEGFVHEKVYDIDTREKLLEIIQSRDARPNFLEFVYDHHTELEKWQQYYTERFRIRIIEWLRQKELIFVFEEDMDLRKALMEEVKMTLFQSKVSKDVASAREQLAAKAKTYYSNEALNPRPKRGRPPKQVAKVEPEVELSGDIFTQVAPAARPFLFIPDITTASAAAFSGKFSTDEELLGSFKTGGRAEQTEKLEALSQKLEALRQLSHRIREEKKGREALEAPTPKKPRAR